MARTFARNRERFSKRQQRTWSEALDRTVRILGTLPSLKSAHGGAWVAGMNAYYRERLRDILNNPPPGCEKMAEASRKLLKQLAA
jgi:hypothetical protein